MKRWLAWLLCLMLTAAGAEETPLRERILAGELAASGTAEVQAWVDGPLTAGAGDGSEWFILGLAGEDVDFSTYRKALRDYVSTHTVRSAPTRQKLALTLLAVGAGDDPFVRQTAQEALGQQGLMSWVWGLHLINNGVPSAQTATDTVAEILRCQLPDGGWAVTGQNADVDVTAMVLQALAPHEEAKDAIDRALTLLSQRQQSGGGFASYGVIGPESAAQVLLALTALGIDPETDPRFRKDASILESLTPFCLADGRLSRQVGGSYSALSTSQVFLALTALERGNVFLLHPAAEEGGRPLPLRAWVLLGILGGTVVIALVMLLKKKKAKSYLVLGLAAALLTALTLNIQSADQYYSAPEMEGDPIGSVTLSIRCDVVAGRAEFIPEDGVILPETEFPIAEGDTVYSVLMRAARTHRIQVETSGGAGMAYVAGMGYLYERQYGDLSGWLYFVNDEEMSVGCEQARVRDGDVLLWHYTCQMGEDLR